MNERDINKERLELALEAAGLDLWENDLVTGEVTRKAMKVLAELGYNEQEASSHVDAIYRIVHPDDVPILQAAVADHLCGVTPQYRCEFRLRAKDGTWIWYANYGRIMESGGAERGKRLIGVTFNINDRKCKEDKIEQINRQLVEQNALLENLNATLQLLAATDSLTGLANRRKLMEAGQNEYKRARRFGHALSLLILDIDLFKHVNDTWGHPAGDLVICAVADVCRKRTRNNLDIVARIGGEEFAVVLPQTDYDSASILAEWLRNEVASQQVVVNDGADAVNVTISIGVATLDADGCCASFEQLLINADKALYRAKEAGRNCVLG